MEENIANKELGARLRALRTYQKKTREQLAEEAEISVQFLAELEFGRKSMTTNVLRRICSALNVSADYLLFGRSELIEQDMILSMLSTLTPEECSYAEELLKTFIRAVKGEKNRTD